MRQCYFIILWDFLHTLQPIHGHRLAWFSRPYLSAPDLVLPIGKTSCPPLMDGINLARRTCLHCAEDDVTLLVLLPQTSHACWITGRPTRLPPFHVTPEDLSAPTDHCEVGHISDHQLVHDRGGFLDALYDTLWVRLLHTVLAKGVRSGTFSPTHPVVLVFKSLLDSLGKSSYRLSRSLAARRKVSRSDGERCLTPRYEVVSHKLWVRCFSASPLPTCASFWYKAPLTMMARQD